MKKMKYLLLLSGLFLVGCDNNVTKSNNGSTTTASDVVNDLEVKSVEKVGERASLDIYEITFSNGSKKTFTIPRENEEIARIWKDEKVSYKKLSDGTIEELWYSADDNGILIPTSKYILDFDEENRTNDEKNYNWNSDTKKWEPDFGEYTEYNADWRPETYIYYDWSTTANDWEYTSKSEREYDEQVRLTLEIQYSWSKEANDWQKEYKHVHIYGEGSYSEYHEYRWSTETNDWVELY